MLLTYETLIFDANYRGSKRRIVQIALRMGVGIEAEQARALMGISCIRLHITTKSDREYVTKFLELVVKRVPGSRFGVVRQIPNGIIRTGLFFVS